MQETLWTGPRGTRVTISTGSTKPPRWALQLIDRVACDEGKVRVRVKWVKCSRGCPHGRAYGSGAVILYTTGDRELDTPLVLHELAHLSSVGDHHGDRFYRALVRIAAREGKVRAISQFQRNKAAIRRAKKALGMVA